METIVEHSDALIVVRKNNNIPETHIAYIISGDVDQYYGLTLEKTNYIYAGDDDFPDEEDEQLNIGEQHIFGRYSTVEGDIIVETEFGGVNSYSHRVLFLFTKDYKSFIKKHKHTTPVPDFKPGIYDIKKGMFGLSLEKKNVENIILPILNESIYIDIMGEITSFIEKEDVYKANNLAYKRGLLFYGPPGNGKTTAIKHIVDKFKNNSIIILADLNQEAHVDFVSSLVCNETVKDILKIIVIEDIDGVAGYNRHNILNMIDGVSSVYKTIFVATTNFPDKLDIALKNRPGRFDAIINIDNPDELSRMTLLRSLFKDAYSDEEYGEAVKETEGFRGAYFREVYVISKLYGISLIEAVRKLNKRIKVFADEELDDEDGSTG